MNFDFWAGVYIGAVAFMVVNEIGNWWRSRYKVVRRDREDA